MELTYATRNDGKVAEAAFVFQDVPEVTLIDLKKIGRLQVLEDGGTLIKNAAAKADAVYQHRQRDVLGEDTGFFVPALNGKPGVSPLCWTGKNTSLGKAERKLLTKLENVTERDAELRSVAVFITKSGKRHEFEESLFGTILHRPAGNVRARFPYERVFVPQGHSVPLALLDIEARRKVLPRMRILDAIRTHLMN